MYHKHIKRVETPSSQIRGFGYGHIGARADVRGYEDRHFFGTIRTPLGTMTVAIVADGVGGSGFGERAAELAIQAVIRALKQTKKTNIPTALGEAIGIANKVVYRMAQQYRDRTRSDMGTTLTMAVIHNNRLYVANVGDSRVYLLKGSDLRQLTIDHSWANERHRYQGIPLEEAKRHPNAHILMRSLGREPKVQVDLGLYLNGLRDHGPRAFKNQGLPLQGDEVILVCSDGLIKNRPGSKEPLLTKQEIIDILHAGDAQQSAKMLVDTAVSRGADDNVTAVVIEMPLHKPARSLIRSIPPKVLLASAFILALAIVGVFWILRETGIFVPPPQPGEIRVEEVRNEAFLGLGPQAQALVKGVRLPRKNSGLITVQTASSIVLRLRPAHYIEAGPQTLFRVGIDPEWEKAPPILERIEANLQQETAQRERFVFYQPIVLARGTLLIRTDPQQKAEFAVFLQDQDYVFKALGTVMGVCYRPPVVRADCFKGTCQMVTEKAKPVPILEGQALVLDLQANTTQKHVYIDYSLQEECYRGLTYFREEGFIPEPTPTPTFTHTPTQTPTFTPSRIITVLPSPVDKGDDSEDGGRRASPTQPPTATPQPSTPTQLPTATPQPPTPTQPPTATPQPSTPTQPPTATPQPPTPTQPPTATPQPSTPTQPPTATPQPPTPTLPPKPTKILPTETPSGRSNSSLVYRLQRTYGHVEEEPSFKADTSYTARRQEGITLQPILLLGFWVSMLAFMPHASKR